MVDFVRYPELLDFLRDEFGDALQSVAYYTGDEARIMYLRSDVEDHYSEEDYVEIAGDVIEEIEMADEKEELYDTGEARCVVRVFDYTVVYLVPLTGGKGLFLSVDPEAGVPNPIQEFVDGCTERMAEEMDSE